MRPMRFAPADAARLAHGIASVAAHLHARGIMHGDLYAHNILHDGAGGALLGDFGAASLYDVNDRVRAARFERLEVRAFGYCCASCWSDASRVPGPPRKPSARWPLRA
jgi:serine/threonine protein kinase